MGLVGEAGVVGCRDGVLGCPGVGTDRSGPGRPRKGAGERLGREPDEWPRAPHEDVRGA